MISSSIHLTFQGDVKQHVLSRQSWRFPGFSPYLVLLPRVILIFFSRVVVQNIKLTRTSDWVWVEADMRPRWEVTWCCSQARDIDARSTSRMDSQQVNAFLQVAWRHSYYYNMQTQVSQMLSWSTHESSYFINIWDIAKEIGTVMPLKASAIRWA